MQYTEGQIGRVFVVRIDNGEDFIVTLRRFIIDKGIVSGSVIFLGALMDGRIVTGPEEPVIPPVPHFVFFDGGWEVFGVGTIYPSEGGPHIHYHASVGRADHALTGCLREKAITYLMVEAVIYEITGLSARREFDEKAQLHLPVLGGGNEPNEGTPAKPAGSGWECSPLGVIQYKHREGTSRLSLFFSHYVFGLFPLFFNLFSCLFCDVFRLINRFFSFLFYVV